MLRGSRVGWLVRAALLALAVGCLTRTEPEVSVQGVGPLVQSAEQAFDRGDYDAAITAYVQALERTPWNDRLVANLVAAYAARAESAREQPGAAALERAAADLQRARELRPDDPLLRANLARVQVEHAGRLGVADPERASELRTEARRLDPALEAGAGEVRPLLERRLDLAFELLERGQLEVGLFRLEALGRDYPESREVALLLGQALGRLASQLEAQGEYARAAETFGRAVDVLAELGPCAPGEAAACGEAEIRLAHHNRIVSWLNAARPADARTALLEAESAGLEFPRLRRVLERRR